MKNNKLLYILVIITAACILFSAIQTVYLFKLTTGQIGNLTYMNGPREENSSTGNNDVEISPIANPEFSIERAASVTDPNKPTLSTIEIAELVNPSTVSIYIIDSRYEYQGAISSGTGFIISDDGYIVTNQHVVDGLETNENYILKVQVPGFDDLIPASVVGSDIQTDIAVVKLMENREYPAVVLGDSDVLQVGELVVAIGNPLGRLDGTVTVGVVSALNREFNNNGYSTSLIQTDASVNTGNSGGPLVNSFGEVVGVINAKISSAEGLGFAIPISNVDSIIESIIQYGYVANRPYLGVTVGFTPEGAYNGAIEGVYVASIDRDGPADMAGLREGDRFISMDGVAITSTGDIIDVRDSHEIGDEIMVLIDRDGRHIELVLVIGDSHEYE
ncbi:MAG: trypsin-like peptidase domain-containing protein [Saccharofermentans sp.]|nr:trypsin-like peptidase domain-containing protein [Saccharofermentans sp.]